MKDFISLAVVLALFYVIIIMGVSISYTINPDNQDKFPVYDTVYVHNNDSTIFTDEDIELLIDLYTDPKYTGEITAKDLNTILHLINKSKANK